MCVLCECKCVMEIKYHKSCELFLINKHNRRSNLLLKVTMHNYISLTNTEDWFPGDAAALNQGCPTKNLPIV